MSSEDKKHRSHLPIPTPERTGLVTYDAKDPDTHFPPIEQLRPPEGARRMCCGGGLGKGGQVTLYVDGKQFGEGTVPMTQAMVFSADDGCDVGEDSGAPVSPDYGSRDAARPRSA